MIFSGKKLTIFLAGILLAHASSAQHNRSSSVHILFVLDASGSMKSGWNGTSKFDWAKNALLREADSLQNNMKNVQFALRVMGHQFPKVAHNCNDSKLELPFTSSNKTNLAAVLNRISPKGQTPLAYSLQQSENDFPKDSTAMNIIIIITDGIETCGGDICAAVRKLREHHIALKPFIIGLALSDSVQKKFQCAAEVLNAASPQQISTNLSAVINIVQHPTSCQVNLFDEKGNATETDVEITFSDHHSNEVLFQTMHTLNLQGLPDTIWLSPSPTYDVTVHTLPTMAQSGIEFSPGQHTVLSFNIPQGMLQIRCNTSGNINPFMGLIYNRRGQMIYEQDLNTTVKFLAGTYFVKLLTRPLLVFDSVFILPDQTTTLDISAAGTLQFSPSETGVASVYLQHENQFEKVFDFGRITSAQTVSLQPGTYSVIFRPDRNKRSVDTRQTEVKIVASKVTSVRL
jgi:Ca-activated chloride channel homolog